MIPHFSVTSTFKKSLPLVGGVFQSEEQLLWAHRFLAAPDGWLRLLRGDGFLGKVGETIIGHPVPPSPAAHVLLVGLGKKTELDLQTARLWGAALTRRLADAQWPTIQCLLPDLGGDTSDTAQAIVEGIVLASYRFLKHKSAPPHKKSVGLRNVCLHVPEKETAGVRAAIERGRVVAEAVLFARDLINEPPSHKTPLVLAQRARALAGGPVQVRVLDKAALKRLGADALLGVNRGSAHPPVMVHFHYKPSKKPTRRVAFVGKGVTFDSGGLSLKPADGMMTMKYDMAGAATVFSLFQALPKLAPAVEVHGITPITENMPGPDAYKPGDVVRAINGKTIEVLNTDAEGRVVLADALSYAATLPVDDIIDIATLTGAVTVALGKAYAALMSNDPKLESALLEAGRATGEKMWPLPLEKTYKEHIHSKVADLKNIGNPGEAGTIIGGLFLEHFVSHKKWAHIDMAGVGWNATGGLLSAPGATGAMVRALLHHILHG